MTLSNPVSGHDIVLPAVRGSAPEDFPKLVMRHAALRARLSDELSKVQMGVIETPLIRHIAREAAAVEGTILSRKPVGPLEAAYLMVHFMWSAEEIGSDTAEIPLNLAHEIMSILLESVPVPALARAKVGA
jgi:hypothetical protein